MPRPSNPINRSYATKHMLFEASFGNGSTRRTRRLLAVFQAYDGIRRVDIANGLNVTPRTIRYWLRAWNLGGPDILLRQAKPGRKRKLSREEFEAKVLPLIRTSSGTVASGWSLADIQRKAKKELGITIGYSALRRYFRWSGLRPHRPVRAKPLPD
jgi:transposase